MTPTVAAWRTYVWLQALAKGSVLCRTALPPFVPCLRFSNPNPNQVWDGGLFAAGAFPRAEVATLPLT